VREKKNKEEKTPFMLSNRRSPETGGPPPLSCEPWLRPQWSEAVLFKELIDCGAAQQPRSVIHKRVFEGREIIPAVYVRTWTAAAAQPGGDV